MSERGGEKAGEKNFFARTAKNTSKRAKRAQEKVKRKLGKSDETKDEIFDRFVENFNKQQDAVQRLQKELKNYINCITAMLNANQLFSEALKQVYEPEWSGRDEFADLLDSLEHYWDNLVQKLSDEVLEPLTSYQAQFPDTKNRISKRSRKVVDYDRHRHHLETMKIKGGKAGEPKKFSQTEEEYNQAKSVYLQIHSDLYEELPALYDSRISFYVSLFQSIFTAEGVFHRETSKIQTQMNDLLDLLAKETSAGTYSTRRPLSVISNASSEGDNSPFENYSKYEQADNSAQSESEEVDGGDPDGKHMELAITEVDGGDPDGKHTELTITEVDGGDPDGKHTELTITEVDGGDPDGKHTELAITEVHVDLDEPSSDTSSPGVEENNSSHPPIRPPPAVPKKPVERPPSPTTVDIEPEEELEKTADIVKDINGPPENDEDEKNLPNDTEREEGSGEKKAPDKEHISHLSYKVVATHPYTGEDEDELTFEKGEIINVVKYEESDDPDDGWLLGIIESTGAQGVFPENFTERLSDDKPS